MSHKNEERISIATKNVQVKIKPFDFLFEYSVIVWDEKVGYNWDC